MIINPYKKINKKLVIFILLSFLSICLIIFNKIKEYNFFTIPINANPFYYIPEDKGGQDILNQDKIGLHLSYVDTEFFKIINDLSLMYAIQIYSNREYLLVKNMRERFLKDKNIILDSKGLSIVLSQSILGKEYFLLYNNFESKIKAQEYCQKHEYFLNNCLIVNVQNLY